MTRKIVFYGITNSIMKSETMSGGDRIFIECVKRWAKNGHKINIFISEQGRRMFHRYLSAVNINYIVTDSSPKLSKLGFRHVVFSIPLFIIRTIKGCISVVKLQTQDDNRLNIVYSASVFWPDVIPGLLLSRKIKGSKWIVGFYLFAPSLLEGFSRTRKKLFKLPTLRDFAFYLNQLPVYWLVKKFADVVFVTNEMDRLKFMDENFSPNRVIAVRGGVDVKASQLVPEPDRKIYDAVFIGRFHPQKGVLELVDIWKYVCVVKKDAKLAMIGNGSLEEDVKLKIRKYGLENNIILFGFKDGIEKIKIFKSSKIVLHPAVYDSGGMAACEAMACGLPGVSFDLPALKTYYPKGMLKTPCFDLEKFAENILRLLNDEELYREMSNDALDWAREWDWDKRADELLTTIKRLVANGES